MSGIASAVRLTPHEAHEAHEANEANETIRCSEIRPLIARFIDRETDPRETLRTSRHLDSCHSCRLRADRLGAMMSACDRIVAIEPPADVAARVMGALRRMKAAAPLSGIRSSKWTGLGVLLAAGAAVLGRRYDLAEKAIIPVRLLARGVIRTTGAAEAAESWLSNAAPSLVRFLDADLGPAAGASTGLDFVVMAHIGGVALLLTLLLAVPVAALTAWMLHTSKS